MKQEITHFEKSKVDSTKIEVTITSYPNWFFKLLGYIPKEEWLLGDYWEWRYFPSGIESNNDTRRFINSEIKKIETQREWDILASQNKEKMNDYFFPDRK